MTIFDMLGQSGVLTLLGMGIVFGFLITMIIVIYLVGKLIEAKGSDNGTGVLAQADASSSPAGVSPQIVAAISAAVAEHQK